MVRTRTMGVVTTLAVAVTSGAAFVAPPVKAATPESASAAAAKAPNVAKLAGSLAKQKIAWSTCGPEHQNAEGEVMCATIKVPKNWHDVDVKDTWDIEVTHLQNRDPSHSRYKGTIFTNPGGPGGDALGWPANFSKTLPDLNPYYNYLAFEPRGIETPSFWGIVPSVSEAKCEYTHPGTDPWKKIEAFGKTCAAQEDIKTLNTEQASYDMDFIRHLMGLEKVDYIGYSYGTWLGAWYSKIFGAKYGGRFLLDSAVDVTQPSLGHAWVWAQAVARDRQSRLQGSLYTARQKDGSDGLGDASVRAVLEDAGGDSFGVPARGAVADDLLEAKRGASSAKRSSGAWKPSPATVREDLIRAELPSAEGDYAAMLRSQLKALRALGKADTSKAATAEPVTVTDDDYLRQIACNDGQWRQGKNWYESNFAKLTEGVQSRVYGGQYQECAYWRTDTVMPEVTDPKNYPDTIVIQTEFDTATDWEIGRVSGMKLPNTSFIAVDNQSDHGVFPSGIEEVDGPVIDFFLTGERPPNVTVAPGLPMSGETVSYEAWTPLDDKARHHGKPNTDPWRLADRQPTLTPVAKTAAELLRPQVAGQEFRTWVSATYGPEGLKVLETIRE